MERKGGTQHKDSFGVEWRDGKVKEGKVNKNSLWDVNSFTTGQGGVDGKSETHSTKTD